MTACIRSFWPLPGRLRPATANFKLYQCRKLTGAQSVAQNRDSSNPPGSPAGSFRHQAGSFARDCSRLCMSDFGFAVPFQGPVGSVFTEPGLIAGGVSSIKESSFRVAHRHTHGLRGHLRRCCLLRKSKERGLANVPAPSRAAAGKSNTRFEVPSICYSIVSCGCFTLFPVRSAGRFPLT